MATPMTADQIVAQLRKWGIPFAEYRDWRNHNRNHKGAWGPVNGFMVHHTGSDAKDQRALLYDGIAGLPGPLSQFGLAQDGTVHLIGWGRCNHAGSGDPDVLAAVVNENYGANPPVDNEAAVDGNSRFYGVEIWYSGNHPMTDAQYASLRKLGAAICDFHGWSEKSVIGHGEWGSPGKWDPGYANGKMMDMAAVRADVAATLGGVVAPPVQQPEPPANTEDDEVSVYGEKELPLGAVGDASARTTTLVPRAAFVQVSVNYVPPGEKVRLRLDVMNANGSPQVSNRVWELGNGWWGYLPVTGPGTVAVQRLSHPGAHVSVAVETR